LLVHRAQRAESYKVLALCYCLPDQQTVGVLRQFAQQAHGWAEELVRAVDVTEDIESLKVDYSRLFVGPYRPLAPPYGSVYLEGSKVMGDSTLAARDVYRREGLDICVKEVPDHIRIELEFISFLISKEDEAAGRGNGAEALCYRRKQRWFLDSHLGVWVATFAREVTASAQTTFYRCLGPLTSDFVLDDLSWLHDGEPRSADS
jgi:TorA maturation chaperone TorD